MIGSLTAQHLGEDDGHTMLLTEIVATDHEFSLACEALLNLLTTAAMSLGQDVGSVVLAGTALADRHGDEPDALEMGADTLDLVGAWEANDMTKAQAILSDCTTTPKRLAMIGSLNTACLHALGLRGAQLDTTIGDLLQQLGEASADEDCA